MTLPRRVVLACTSAVAPLHKGHNTGIWINEAQHPFNVFRNAGFEVDLVSETGTWGEDWLSVQPDYLNGKDKEAYEGRSSEFRSKLDSMLTPDKIDASKVSADREDSSALESETGTVADDNASSMGSSSRQPAMPLCSTTPMQEGCRRLLSRSGFKAEWSVPYATGLQSFRVSSTQLPASLSPLARDSPDPGRRERKTWDYPLCS